MRISLTAFQTGEFLKVIKIIAKTGLLQNKLVFEKP